VCVCADTVLPLGCTTAKVACCYRHRCQHLAIYNNLPDNPERGSSLFDEGHAAYRISSLSRACVLACTKDCMQKPLLAECSRDCAAHKGYRVCMNRLTFTII
jgi:hypothetical protein